MLPGDRRRRMWMQPLPAPVVAEWQTEWRASRRERARRRRWFIASTVSAFVCGVVLGSVTTVVLVQRVSVDEALGGR